MKNVELNYSPQLAFRGASREFLLYFLGSILGLAADAALLVLFVTKFGMPVLFATLVAYMAGLFVVYFWSTRFAFEKRRCSGSTIEFFVFALLGAAGLILTMLIMNVLFGTLGVDYRIAKFFATGASFMCNFALRKWLLFSSWQGKL